MAAAPSIGSPVSACFICRPVGTPAGHHGNAHSKEQPTGRTKHRVDIHARAIASLSQLDLSGRSFSVNGTVARALFVADETRLV
jgi:hypothetical protein